MTKAMKTSRVRKPKTGPAPLAPTVGKISYQPSPASVARGPGGKLGRLADQMRRPEGATIAQMVELTGWKVRSVRGALAGALKKHFGLPITSEKTDGVRVYRISSDDQAEPA